MKHIFVFAVMLLFAVCVWGQNINEKTGLPEGYAIWFMNAECGETRYFEKENLIGISLSDTGNWSLTYKSVDVQPGSDWTVYAVAGGRGIGILNGGGVSVGGFLSDKDQVVDWGPSVWKGGNMSLELMSCDIHIPENATKLTPQVGGHGGGEIFVYAIEAVKKGEKPSLSVPHTVLPVWNDTKPITVPLDQEEKYGVKGIYLPGEECVFRVGRLGIGCKELKYIITDLFGNKADEGETAYGQEIKFVPKKAGYYEISLSGEGIYGENITKKLVGSSSCIFVSAPKKFTPWGNPFGGQSPNSLDMYERLNITWDKFICYNLDTGSHSEMPTDYEDYKNKVAEKVRSGIFGKYHTKGVEIWNEPENEIPGVYQKWEELAKTAKATTEGIHSVSPETKTMFDICHLGNLTKYHEAGGVGTYDVLSLHPYCPALYNEPKYPQPPEEGGIISMLLAAREQLDREGMAEAEIWTTEYGWTTGSLPQGASLEEQAKYMVRSSVLQLACGVKRVNPFRLTDVPFWGEMDGKFGFIRDDRTPKPVLATYSILAQTVDDNPYIGQIDMGDNIGAFIFGKTGKTVLVLWKFGGEAEVNVPIKQNCILRDMFGNDMPFKGGNVTAGENPQYFIFNLSPKSV
ncbi:MAG: hypothetical protein KBT47_08135, partial [Armatimonadetes bacterium]|nr:hypothetical protein [Candidatus Hippobium faecium]